MATGHVVAVAIANKTARIVWAVMAKGETTAAPTRCGGRVAKASGPHRPRNSDEEIILATLLGPALDNGLRGRTAT